MTNLLCFLGGLLVGAGSLWWLQRQHIQYLTDELATATDRLYGAWKDGAVIPTREQVKPPEPQKRPEPLDDELLHLVMDYQSAEGQQDAETFIRQKAAMGWGVERIREALNAQE